MSDRLTDTLLGLAYGDAVGFPSLFHRFHVLPAKRHDFLFETNKRLSRDHLLPLALPFTHRQSESTLTPGPSDDTEYAVFTLQTLLDLGPGGGPDGILDAWRRELVPRLGEIWTRFSERAAIENLQKGLVPPATGNDNPLHYEDAAVCRAVAVGLYHSGDAAAAADLAGAEAAISQAEDGIWGAQAVAAVIAALSGGESLDSALAAGEEYFPRGSWIAAEASKTNAARERASSLHELALLLARNVINNVYSFGNAAPEVVPAAFALAREAKGDLISGVNAAVLIAKSADSLPPLVGAICAAANGADDLGELWRSELSTCRGCCLPFTEGVSLIGLGKRLLDYHQARAGRTK